MVTFNFMLYLLAVLTCLACTVLLFRGYAASRQALLLWSALCFVFLTLNNLLLFFDLVVFAGLDLRPYRLAAALAGLGFLIYGFIFESE
jgi:Family of unknown function (DUF5985)